MDLSQGSFSRVFPSQIQLLFPSPFLGPAPGKSRDPVGGWNSLPTINLISREFPGKFGNRAVPPWDFPGMFPELFQSSGRGLEVPQDLLGFPGRNSLGFLGSHGAAFPFLFLEFQWDSLEGLGNLGLGKPWKAENGWVGMGSLGLGIWDWDGEFGIRMGALASQIFGKTPEFHGIPAQTHTALAGILGKSGIPNPPGSCQAGKFPFPLELLEFRDQSQSRVVPADGRELIPCKPREFNPARLPREAAAAPGWGRDRGFGVGSLGSGARHRDGQLGIRTGSLGLGLWDRDGEFGIGLEAGICHRWIFGITPPCFSAHGWEGFSKCCS